MKKFYISNYYRVVIASWIVITSMLWIQYIHLSTLAEATFMLITLIPAIYISLILTNKWLPKAVQKKHFKLFLFQFIGTQLLIAFILATSYQAMRWAEAKGYFPPSILLADNNNIFMDFIFAIPSALVINFGFCGLRFLYEHMKLRKAHLEIQIQMLQAQINPHFMFNVLNHIHTLMQTNVDLASVLLLQYADLLRFQLYKGKCEHVRLEEELQFLQNFVEIEKLRRGGKINVESNWLVSDKNLKIPPLLLIVFIENAFKYASHTLSGQGFVRIRFEQRQKDFSLEVENSKSAISPKKDIETSGIGLDNIKKRLSLLYGENHNLTLKDNENTYYSKLEIWNT